MAPTVVVTAPSRTPLPRAPADLRRPTRLAACSTPASAGPPTDSVQRRQQRQGQRPPGHRQLLGSRHEQLQQRDRGVLHHRPRAGRPAGTSRSRSPTSRPAARTPRGRSAQDNALNSSAGTSITFYIDYDPREHGLRRSERDQREQRDHSGSTEADDRRGLTVSTSTGRTALAIATGSYTGGVSISGSSLNGRRLLGGFSTSTWKRAAPNSSGNGTSVSGVGTGVAVSVDDRCRHPDPGHHGDLVRGRGRIDLRRPARYRRERHDRGGQHHRGERRRRQWWCVPVTAVRRGRPAGSGRTGTTATATTARPGPRERVPAARATVAAGGAGGCGNTRARPAHGQHDRQRQRWRRWRRRIGQHLVHERQPGRRWQRRQHRRYPRDTGRQRGIGGVWNDDALHADHGRDPHDG